MEATRGEVTGHAMKLEEELEHTKRVQGETTERLVSRSADIESVTRSLVSNFLLKVKRYQLYSKCSMAFKRNFDCTERGLTALMEGSLIM